MRREGANNQKILELREFDVRVDLPSRISISKGSGLGFEPEPNCGNRSYHTKTRTVAIGPVLPPKTRHFNFTIMAAIK
jgi:hypothetical protein